MKKTIKWSSKNIPKKENIHDNDQKKFYFICPHCQHTISFENEILKDILVLCPNCGQKGIIRSLQKKQDITKTNVSDPIIENTPLIEVRKDINIPAIEIKILGIILIAIGITLYFVINLFSIKISLALIIIGVIVFTFVPNNRLIFLSLHRAKNKEKPKNEKNTNNYSFINSPYIFFKNQFDISEKIAIAFILLIILIYLLTGVNDIDIFLIFIFLGTLLIKVLFDDLFPVQLKQRMNIFVIVFLLIFIIIVIKRFLSLTNILS